MRSYIVAGFSALALVGCSKPEEAPAAPEEAAAPMAADHNMAADANSAGTMIMTPEDPGGFTADGFTFHTMPGSKHVVRLEAPGTDTWKPASTGEPAVKLLGTREETTADGKKALILEYEMLQSGNAAIEFQRMEDGQVEATRTIHFMVH